MTMWQFDHVILPVGHSLQIALLSACLFTGYPTSGLSQSVEVATGNYAEPVIAVDPNNILRMVICANKDFCAVTTDGGMNWDHPTLGEWESRGDHVAYADANGNFYVAKLSSEYQVVFCRSSDLLTWECDTLQRYSQAYQDKPWFAIDHLTKSNRLYAVWTEYTRDEISGELDSGYITFAHSVDRGQSWNAPTVIGSKKSVEENTWLTGAQVAVGASGVVFVCWTETDSLFFCRSVDGGQNFTPIVGIAKHGGVDLSIDGVLKAWSMPVLVCDTTQSMYRGRLYVVWAGLTESGDAEIFETHSDDEGESWSRSASIVRVDDQTHQYLPAVAITDRGHVVCTFLDRRQGNLSHPTKYTTLYAARSTNGGETWENFPLSTNGAEQVAHFPGDYMGLAVSRSEAFAVWSIGSLQSSVIYLTHWQDSLASHVQSQQRTPVTRVVRKQGGLFISHETADPTVIVELYDVIGRKVYQQEVATVGEEQELRNVPQFVYETYPLFAQIKSKDCLSNSNSVITLVVATRE